MILQSKCWYDKVEYYEIDLDPKDFIYCDDEDDLWENVKEMVETSEPVRERIYDYDSEFQLPEEFINEWRELKNNEKVL